MLADIAVGDSWNTKDGYPDFEEVMEKVLLWSERKQGQKLFLNAVQNHT